MRKNNNANTCCDTLKFTDSDPSAYATRAAMDTLSSVGNGHNPSLNNFRLQNHDCDSIRHRRQQNEVRNDAQRYLIKFYLLLNPRELLNR